MHVMQDLVIQAADVATADLKALHAMSGASGIARISTVAHQAFRLTGASIAAHSSVAAHCAKAGLDFAFVPSGRTFGDYGLLAMDMDSTLITIECIDEIADFTGRKPEVAAITASAMRGEIDWPESLRQRVSLLAGLDESVLQRVYDERLRLSPGAEALIAAAKKHNVRLLLVSGGFTFFTERLRSRLGIDYAFSNILETMDGRLTGRVNGPLCDAEGKAARLRETASKLSVALENCVAIGDGANDLKMMSAAELSIAYHAKPLVQAAASIAINHVGLDGVVALFA